MFYYTEPIVWTFEAVTTFKSNADTTSSLKIYLARESARRHPTPQNRDCELSTGAKLCPAGLFRRNPTTHEHFRKRRGSLFGVQSKTNEFGELIAILFYFARFVPVGIVAGIFCACCHFKCTITTYIHGHTSIFTYNNSSHGTSIKMLSIQFKNQGRWLTRCPFVLF